MGLYDWIRIEIECPNCKKQQIAEFQTYDLGRTFNEFKLGEKLNVGTPLSLIHICEFCGCFIDAWGNIEDGKLKNIEIYSYKINLKDNIILKSKLLNV